ncbi:unnamed protein product [Ilex paraguariensis]|uniref:VQ domain-containing protein n=1 Tax=Ilex paraguariensis TaxID=185542 RepID=A0ABC8QVA9_9AQUA
MEKHSNTIMAPSSPTPTTFVQADTTTFRDVVQKLTGASGGSQDKLPVTHPARLSTKPLEPTGIRRSTFKLQERRQHTMRKLEIKLGLFSPVQSPVTPLGTQSSPEEEEEERAIGAKGFYMHPSPRKAQPPELLTLFPLTSPRH